MLILSGVDASKAERPCSSSGPSAQVTSAKAADQLALLACFTWNYQTSASGTVQKSTPRKPASDI